VAGTLSATVPPLERSAYGHSSLETRLDQPSGRVAQGGLRESFVISRQVWRAVVLLPTELAFPAIGLHVGHEASVKSSTTFIRPRIKRPLSCCHRQ
jgi:hypothetical protein